jgi:hypothetical protein
MSLARSGNRDAYVDTIIYYGFDLVAAVTDVNIVGNSSAITYL